ncbi:MAG TPA: DinB family protein [Fimbriimonas sp.]|nr:DinB family protein [Fimbriimonas sp.]
MIVDVAPLPGYPELYGILCATLQDATNEWRWEINAELGPEITTWRPRPGGPSIGAILLHMITAERYWFEQVALGRSIPLEDKELLLWDEIDVNEARWPDVPLKPLSWYFALQDRFRAVTLEAVKSWASPETLLEHHGRQTSLRWILGHVIQHEAYHGGQIVALYTQWNAQNA